MIPPASPAATSVSRIASSRLVLPWSTWPITVTTGGARQQIAGALFLDLFFLNQLLFERDHLHDSVERFGEARRRRHVERLVDAGENAAIQQHLQQILGANVQLLRQLANRDSFGNRDFARLALNRRRPARPAPCARHPHPRVVRTG